jgi:hypothetical protein
MTLKQSDAIYHRLLLQTRGEWCGDVFQNKTNFLDTIGCVAIKLAIPPFHHSFHSLL